MALRHRSAHRRREVEDPNAPPPRHVLERAERLLEYHRASKHTFVSIRTNPQKLDKGNQPSAFLTFDALPKVSLPATVLDAPSPALAVLGDGLAALPEGRQRPPHDLKTLASWLYMADGITAEGRVGRRGEKISLRSVPSSGALFPFEVYVAAFAIEGLEPGLYHYDVREFALRKMRDGPETLTHIKKGRPDLEFLKTVPAALLVSSVFCRASWKYRQRAYRFALLDAGQLVQNLVTCANGLGVPTTTRLRMNDRTMCELIGVPPDAEFAEAEAVQAMVAWADEAKVPMPPPERGAADRPLPRIARPRPAARIVPYGSILAAHEDCVAPGVAVRDVRPPLTELAPVTLDGHAVSIQPPVPAKVDCDGDGAPPGGPSLRHVLLSRRSSRDFRRAAVPADALWATARLAFRGGSYTPVYPSGPHVGLVRPMWIVNAVTGMEPGLWYYHPPDDRWFLLRRGNFRAEAQYVSLEQSVAGNGSAVCFLVADLKTLTTRGGPDTYRLAHLEAGIVSQRTHLAAAALGVGCSGIGAFYDDDTRKFLELEKAGWEAIYGLIIGVPAGDPGAAGNALA